jgi:HK97 family phage prohead protease
METLRELDIVRAVPPAPEIRAADTNDDILGTLYGHFSVFDSWYRISSWWEGDFMESIAPGAFRKTMAERRDRIVAAFDHGFDYTIGDKVLGPIDDLREDGTGAYYEVGLMDTSYNRDLYPGLKRGLYGASFRFQVIKDEWDDEPGQSDHNPDGVPERTIKEVRLYEFGPVTYPASPAATAGMRSMCGMTDAYYQRLRSRDPSRVDALAARTSKLRTPDAPPAAQALAPEGAAPHHTDEPDHHSSGDQRRAQRARRIREARLAALT